MGYYLPRIAAAVIVLLSLGIGVVSPWSKKFNVERGGSIEKQVKNDATG